MRYKLLVGSHSRMEGDATKVYRRSTDPNNPTIIDLSEKEAEQLKGRVEPLVEAIVTREESKSEVDYKSSAAEEKITEEVKSSSQEEDRETESIESKSPKVEIPDVTTMPLTRVRSILKNITSLGVISSMYEAEEGSKKPRAAILRVIKERYLELGGEEE